MNITEQQFAQYTRRIMLSRMRLLCNHGFYGLLLMHVQFSLSEEHATAWTDGCNHIWFNPGFLNRITDQELDYAMMHQIVHLALQHPFRRDKFDPDIFDKAADIVVNSNILYSNNNDITSITLKDFGGEQPHLAPDKTEGYEHSVEDIYEMLLYQTTSSDDKGKDHEAGGDGGKKKQDDNSENDDPLDDEGNGEGQGSSGGNDKEQAGNSSGWDSHLTYDESKDSFKKMEYSAKWQQRMQQVAEAISIRESEKNRGLMPAFAQRYIEALKKPQTNWREVLNDFVQDEINDYTFTPPDRRLQDIPFFLPDYNERDEKPGKILFMIDTSGSMTDIEIAACYAEIKGAIDQFDGKLEGWLGFFDAAVYEPIPFVDEEELLKIKPVGGGGTNFHIVFQWVKDFMGDDLPNSIVILTDGYAPFPDQEMAMDIPVLWIIDNEKQTPPWGVVTRIEPKELMDALK